MSEKIKNVRYALVGILLFYCAALQAQSVTGNVKDSMGEPVIGATVMEKGTKNGTVTDFDGNFTLKMSSTSHDLQISYVGMKTANVKVGNKTQLDVTLEDDATTLNEVVAIGYGSKARKDLTGSVGSVSGAKLAAVPVASAAEALAGKIAGVQVTSVDGQPGGDINIRVRGATSVTQSNEPLYIVDGFQQSNINDIPPSDIASIDVLKDASLTAIYGAKGGNGVIVVTTKSAQSGKVKVSFNGRLTWSHIKSQLELMDTDEFLNYQWDRAVSAGTRSSRTRSFRYNFGNPYDFNDLYKSQAYNNWQDEVLGNTPMSYQGNVTIGGGNETTKFNLSVTQSEDKGIILGSGVRRTVINLKLNTKLHKNLDFTYNPKMTYRRDEGAGGDNVGSGGIIDVLRYMPTEGLRGWGSYNGYSMDGSYIESEDPDEANSFALTNPVADIYTNVQKKHSYTISNQFSLKWTPIKGLLLRTEGNYNISFRDSQRYYGYKTKTGKDNNNLPVATVDNSTVQSYTWTNTASYDMTLKDIHNFSFLLGQEIYNTWTKSSSQTNRYFAKTVDANTAFNNMGLGTPRSSTTSLSTSNRTASFFGQVSYNFDHKYLLSATLRGDGSTKFAPGHQWGWFPSVSGAWVINKEKFLKDVKWIDQLKLRVAYGLAGNNNINSDLWRYLYSNVSNGGPGFGESASLGESYYGTPSTYPNEGIKWETTVTRNLAADITLWGGRLNITPEFYWNTTRDLLYNSTIATVSGYEKQMQNIGRVENKGMELTLSGDILRGKDYVLSANLTLGHNKMTIKELNSTDNVLYNTANKWKSADEADYKLEVGGELGLFYGYVYDGLYTPGEFTFDGSNFAAVPKTQQFVDGVMVAGTVINNALGSSNSGEATLPGKIKLKDLNGDGIVDQNDKTVIGNTNPTMQGGFGFSGQYKDFDFTMNFTYMLGFDLYNATAYALSSSTTSANEYFNVLKKFANNRWTYADNGSMGNQGQGLYRNTTSLYQANWGTTAEAYVALNANSTQWNPADLVTKAMISNFVEDGSFLRCTDITIGYTLPKNIVKKIWLSKVRVYVSASNLFTITNYTGYDPEIDIQSGLTPSMDFNRYPRARSYSFGLNVDF